MTTTPETPESGGRHHLVDALETSIRIGLIALMVVWCFFVLRPFVVLLAWAVIIAEACYPLYERLETAFKGHRWPGCDRCHPDGSTVAARSGAAADRNPRRGHTDSRGCARAGQCRDSTAP